MLGGAFPGDNHDDVLSVYNGYPWLLSKVFSHLRRHVQKLIKFGRGVMATIGEVFLELIDEPLPSIVSGETADTAITNSGPMPSKCGATSGAPACQLRATIDAGKILRSLPDKAQQWWYFLTIKSAT